MYQNLGAIETPFVIKSTLGTKPDIVFSAVYNDGSNEASELLTNTSGGAFPTCGPSGFAEGVQVCAPGATATSPVKFSVGTGGPTPMRTAQVWVDGKKTAEQLTHAFSTTHSSIRPFRSPPVNTPSQSSAPDGMVPCRRRSLL